LNAIPGETVDLTALLADTAGPKADRPVTWTFTNNALAAELKVSTGTTNGEGLAHAQVSFGKAEGVVTVQVESEGATSQAIWRVEILAHRKRLLLLPSPQVTVNTQQTEGVGKSQIGVALPFRVRAIVETDEGLRPLASQPVTCQLMQVTGSVVLLPVDPVLTQGDGTAEFFFIGNTGIGLNRISCGFAATEGTSVTLNADFGARTAQCESPTDCAPGRFCINKSCVAGGSATCDPVTGDTCPTGYVCQSQRCELADVSSCVRCPDGFVCASDGRAALPEPRIA